MWPLKGGLWRAACGAVVLCMHVCFGVNVSLCFEFALIDGFLGRVCPLMCLWEFSRCVGWREALTYGHSYVAKRG